MNEKKAIVFFFFVVFFFCFSFFLLVVVVVPSTYVTYTSFSLSVFVLGLCLYVFFFSFSFFVRSPASVLLARRMCVCVCVFQFPLFAVVAVFFGGLTVFQTLLPFLRALGFFFVFCFNVVIRGGVFLHFFFLLYRTKHTNVHTYRHGDTHTQTDDRRKVRARR